jgi:hypothetical protein
MAPFQGCETGEWERHETPQAANHVVGYVDGKGINHGDTKDTMKKNDASTVLP